MKFKSRLVFGEVIVVSDGCVGTCTDVNAGRGSGGNNVSKIGLLGTSPLINPNTFTFSMSEIVDWSAYLIQTTVLGTLCKKFEVKQRSGR